MAVCMMLVAVGRSTMAAAAIACCPVQLLDPLQGPLLGALLFLLLVRGIGAAK